MLRAASIWGVTPTQSIPVEETAEQVLARLTRYAESLRNSPGQAATLPRSAVRPDASPQIVVYTSPSGRDTLLPAPDTTEEPRSIGRAAASQAIGVAGCIVAIILLAVLGRTLALVLIGVLGVAGIVAAARRVPMASSWTIGLVIGVALGLLS